MAHGSERVIDEIRDHAYQISVQSDNHSLYITFSFVNLMFSNFRLIVLAALNLFLQTLSEFQYVDSSGRDQGNNVRRKSQSLVLLVNDKERIQEARQKAASNRDK